MIPEELVRIKFMQISFSDFSNQAVLLAMLLDDNVYEIAQEKKS